MTLDYTHDALHVNMSQRGTLETQKKRPTRREPGEAEPTRQGTDMNNDTCSVPDCDRGAYARGWCSKHYQRWRTHGDPRGGGHRYSTPEEAFVARTEHRGECLIWTGSKGGNGYGYLQVNGAQTLAHRYAYEEAYGPVPDGMVIDHICHNRTCVDVDHLRLATVAQNSANRAGAHRFRKRNLPRGVYPNGPNYMARVRYLGVSYYLGTYATPEEASAVAVRARHDLFGEFAGRD